MSHKPLNIEDLLETMSSRERPGDAEHRYQLRRHLLYSRFFEDAHSRTSRWDRMMSYTAPLVAGGMMVGVFALMAVYAPVEPEIGPQTPSSNTSIVQVPGTSTTEVIPLRVEDFLSDPNEPTVALVGFKTGEASFQTRYVPVASQQYVRTQ